MSKTKKHYYIFIKEEKLFKIFVYKNVIYLINFWLIIIIIIIIIIKSVLHLTNIFFFWFLSNCLNYI